MACPGGPEEIGGVIGTEDEGRGRLPKQLAGAALIGPHHQQAARHGFQHAEAEGLERAGRQEDMMGVVDVAHLVLALQETQVAVPGMR